MSPDAGLLANVDPVPRWGIFCFRISHVLKTLPRNCSMVEIASLPERHPFGEVEVGRGVLIRTQCYEGKDVVLKYKVVHPKNISIFSRLSCSWFEIGNACEKH